MTQHIHIYDYEHGTRCWCGEYDPLKRPKPCQIISLRAAREAKLPRTELPADCGDGGAA